MTEERASPEIFDVLIERTASDAVLEETRRAFDEAGLRANVRAALEFKSVEAETIVALLVMGPLTAFLSAFAGKAGADAYVALKRFVVRVSAREGGRRAALWIQDRSGKRIDLVIPDDLDDDAYRALFQFDLETLPQRVDIRYEHERGCWMLGVQRKPVPLLPANEVAKRKT